MVNFLAVDPAPPPPPPTRPLPAALGLRSSLAPASSRGSRPPLPPPRLLLLFVEAGVLTPLTAWALRHQTEGLAATAMWLGWALVASAVWRTFAAWVHDTGEASS